MSVEDLAAPRAQGGVARLLTRLFMKRTRVVDVEPVGAGFRLLTLESPGFRTVDWTPGHKLQVAMGGAFETRTYTPIEWDAVRGVTRILGRTHGDGPGATWVRDAREGETCDVLGPRSSLDVGRSAKADVLVGDETSIGLAHARAFARPGASPTCLLEVDAPDDVSRVATRLGLRDLELIARTTDGSHARIIADRLSDHARTGATFVLTGKATSIQQQGRALKAAGVGPSRIATKAYWAPGKAGLD